jgi:stearoyl-CoA 9-desaturase NADPH oxidoreductase
MDLCSILSVAEQGAIPQVSPVRRRALRAVGSFFTPLLPDDYLEMVNPLWSTRELRGRIVRVEPETPEAVTVLIRPGHRWVGHRPGQYVRIGVVVDGVHHWRAYSLTSEPGRGDGCISITPKLVEAGKVSPHLVRCAGPGEIVRLGGVEGTFVLPEPLPPKLLFLSAGSGITPIMSMLRSLAGRDALAGAVHIHSARTEADVIFGGGLRRLDRLHPGYSLHLRLTGAEGRVEPGDLDMLCPDWRERHAFLSGPAEMLEAMGGRWAADGDPELLHVERFQPLDGPVPGDGEGGTVYFTKSGMEASCASGVPILAGGEEAGAALPFGCRMGICHTCVAELRSGEVRDLRTGEVHGSPGEMVRTCVNAPEGPIEIAL